MLFNRFFGFADGEGRVLGVKALLALKCNILIIYLYPFSALALSVGRQEGRLACEKLIVGILMVVI